jgi:hypothetical protein
MGLKKKNSQSKLKEQFILLISPICDTRLISSEHGKSARFKWMLVLLELYTIRDHSRQAGKTV